MKPSINNSQIFKTSTSSCYGSHLVDYNYTINQLENLNHRSQTLELDDSKFKTLQNSHDNHSSKTEIILGKKKHNKLPVSDKYKNGRWNVEEHKRFIEAISLYGNEWKKVQRYISTRSSTQARSHAQKFFLRLRKKLNLPENDKITFQELMRLKENELAKILNTDAQLIGSENNRKFSLFNIILNFNSSYQSKSKKRKSYCQEKEIFSGIKSSLSKSEKEVVFRIEKYYKIEDNSIKPYNEKALEGLSFIENDHSSKKIGNFESEEDFNNCINHSSTNTNPSPFNLGFSRKNDVVELHTSSKNLKLKEKKFCKGNSPNSQFDQQFEKSRKLTTSSEFESISYNDELEIENQERNPFLIEFIEKEYPKDHEEEMVNYFYSNV
jgi:SHAQKYF class myb-like DNA-binding protein